MQAYIWFILAAMLAVGILVGYMAGRSKNESSQQKAKELEEQLDNARQEMQTYKHDVSQHFEKTARLFNQLTNDYRSVYEHLAESSDKLCGDQVPKLKSLTGEHKTLEATQEESAEAKDAIPESETVTDELSRENQAIH